MSETINTIKNIIDLYDEATEELNFDIAVYKKLIKKLVNSQSQKEIVKQVLFDEKYWEIQPDDTGVNSYSFLRKLVP